MPNFQHRSKELELMDFPIENPREIFQNFKELVFINRFLGGAQHGYKAIQRINNRREVKSIVDIGAGAGDFLEYVHKRKASFHPELELVGVDTMAEAQEFAEATFSLASLGVRWESTDYKLWMDSGNAPDVIHAGLFCHHLNDEQLIDFLRISHQHAKCAVVINDLHRHPVAYYSIQWITRLFSKSRYTKNDAPLSVLRGFTKQEWIDLMKRAGISEYEIHWKWAFRHLIVIPK